MRKKNFMPKSYEVDVCFKNITRIILYLVAKNLIFK